jgi:uncharacterized membrane protein
VGLETSTTPILVHIHGHGGGGGGLSPDFLFITPAPGAMPWISRNIENKNAKKSGL